MLQLVYVEDRAAFIMPFTLYTDIADADSRISLSFIRRQNNPVLISRGYGARRLQGLLSTQRDSIKGPDPNKKVYSIVTW